MTTGVIMGNLLAAGFVEIPLTPTAVAANTTVEQTFTLPGIRTRDMIVGVSKPTFQMGLAIGNYRVAGFDQIAITFINATAGSITPTAGELYRIFYARPEASLNGIQI